MARRKKSPETAAPEWTAFERTLDEHGAAQGDLWDIAVGSNVITAAALPEIVRFLLERWRPAPRGAPHKGALWVATRTGEERVPRRDLARELGMVGILGDRDGSTAQKLLQCFGAAFAATAGRADRAGAITACLLQLLPGDGEDRSATASAMLRRARDPESGPPWARCLRRPEPSPAALKDKWLTDFRTDMWRMGWPEAPRVAPRLQPRVDALNTITTAEVAQLIATIDAALVRLGATAAVAPSIAPHPASRPTGFGAPSWRGPPAGPPPGA